MRLEAIYIERRLEMLRREFEAEGVAVDLLRTSVDDPIKDLAIAARLADLGKARLSLIDS